MRKLIVRAPAKVNYRLDVLGRRSDGYHDLRMVMQRIDLCDEMEIALTDEPGIRVTCDRDGVPDGPGNIAWRAADTLLCISGKTTGVSISIIKNIPVAAGLGGGSSDAASVLMGLNDLLGLGLADGRLMEIGVTLGADVPFFIFKKTALAEGIGERLSPIEGLPRVWLVLVNPNIPVSTAWVYKKLQLTNKNDAYTLPQFSGTVEDICSLLSNDLETVTVTTYPVIGEIKERLCAAGACGALMSGSGPTVFGVFASEDSARQAREEFPAGSGWFTAIAQTLC